MLLLALAACHGGKTPDDSQPPVDSAPQVVEAPDISELLAPVLEAHPTPALAGAVLSSTELLGLGAVGFRQEGGEDPVLREDPFHLGSDTKAMTATLLALLAPDGNLQLDTRVETVWPEAHEGWHGVTMLDLLHHRGGAASSLGQDRPDLWSALWANPDDPRGAREDFAAGLLAAPPDETVGEYTYSNAGYMLVGAAIEAREDAAWEALMQRELFEPLGMQGCSFGAPPDPAPWGHREEGGGLTPVDPSSSASDNPPGLGPAGTVHCPLAGWAAYAAWVLQGARGEDSRLDAATWETLLTPEGQYAAGWGVGQRNWADGTVLTHNGSNTMWFAVIWVAPEIDRAFLAATNAASGEAQAATDAAVSAMIQDQ
ncbi:MAG: beta-lactamase family protein [Alphaproteobacteria bacterium]|nr:beta-lactamase family protein [Alphaproteobacteria bacterium]